MEIDSLEQLDVFVAVCKSLTRLYGRSFRRMAKPRIPTLLVTELGQPARIEVRKWHDHDVLVRVACLVGVSVAEEDDDDREVSQHCALGSAKLTMGAVDETIAAVLSELNWSTGLVTYSLDEDDDLEVSYTMLGALCTDAKLRRAIAAVARDCAKMRAAFTEHSSRVQQLPRAQIVDTLAFAEAARLDDELRQLALDDTEKLPLACRDSDAVNRRGRRGQDGDGCLPYSRSGGPDGV